jgi:hypothetical protein
MDPSEQAIRHHLKPSHPRSRRSLCGALAAFIAIVWPPDRGLAASAKPRRQRRRSRAQAATPHPTPQRCGPNAQSGIAGTVLIGPMCPVMTQDDPCPDPPYAATLMIRDALGHELCTTQSGADGLFRVGLPPGSYEVVPVSGAAGLPYASPQPVTVEPGRCTEVLISYDSGIR